MTGKTESISVEIFGQTYNVRGEGDPAYLTELARLVDSRMHEIASQLSTAVEPMKIAVLAALNIADELARSRKRHEVAAELWMGKTEELTEKLGKSLAETTKRTQI
ncbi:MAG TPA: cell division protein ZapA [Thermoanaerobaculia bacterium]|nr:cell division protein ZapA [Thermoanaerobaculia bacterium]